MSEFASSKYTAGQLNAMVKKLRKLGGESGPERLLNDELALVAPGQPPLLKVLDTVELPAVSRFVAKDAFTKANGIVWMGENFTKFILPVVEENVPEATVQVSELVRDAENLAIAAELKVHERGRLSVAHFFQAIRDRIPGIRTDGWWNAAFVIGADGETWAVRANLYSDGWDVDADRLGDRHTWDAGNRFLSR